jgi:hypothetical protein
MIRLIASGTLIVTAVGVCGLVTSRRRRRNDPVFRRSHALAALRRIAEAPHPMPPPCHPVEAIEHVRLI